MEGKEYFEQLMQRYNTESKGRSLRSFCKDVGVDYKWVLDCKREYPKEVKKEAATFLPIEITEKEPEKKIWEVDNLTLKSPDGEFIEMKTNSLTIAAMLLSKFSLP